MGDQMWAGCPPDPINPPAVTLCFYFVWAPWAGWAGIFPKLLGW
jgi:hypothetical protein